MTAPEDEAIPKFFEDAEPEENAIIAWAKAIVGGIGDTAKDMLEEGRAGSRRAMAEYWDRFDAKTKHRRK